MLSLESKCKDFQVNIAALREEILERESVIAQNYSTIQLLRRRLADMEKHKFVLGYRTQVSLPTAVPRNPGCLQSVRDTSLLAAFALLFRNKQLLYPMDDVTVSSAKQSAGQYVAYSGAGGAQITPPDSRASALCRSSSHSEQNFGLYLYVS